MATTNKLAPGTLTKRQLKTQGKRKITVAARLRERIATGEKLKCECGGIAIGVDNAGLYRATCKVRDAVSKELSYTGAKSKYE